MTNSYSIIRHISFILLLLSTWNHHAYAELFTAESSTKTPATIEADKMHYDHKNQTVSATGNVIVTQGDYKLQADSISYNQKKDELSAGDQVKLEEPNGTVIYADSVTLSRGLTQGKIISPNAQFPDKSHARADDAVQINAHTLQLNDGAYSACPVCKADKSGKTKPPLWQIKANRTIFDDKAERVSYRHALFELYGIPIAYTPYFSHATPKATRRSGFLIPKYKSDSNLGTMVSLPYYYSISPNKDITLTPTFTSKVGPILAGEYRHLLKTGNFSLEGTITNPNDVNEFGNEINNHNIRGHIEGRGHFDLNDKWSWGFDGKRATDDTYLRKYQYNDTDTLRSRAYLSYSNNRNFLKAETLSFQGLQASDDPGKTPLVLPHIQTLWESNPGFKNSTFSFTSDILSLTRDESTSSYRASLEGSWKIPIITKNGHVFEWRNSLRADSYIVDDVILSDGTTADGTQYRVIPESQLRWSYPLVAQKRNYRVFLEPVVDFIVSPYGNNSDEIPNEDSQDIEFSDVNLFSSNHFTGLDYIEEGPRVNYGAKLNIDHDTMGYTSLLLGQAYRFSKNNLFDEGSGLSDNQSDIVGRMAYSYENLFNIAYQFRLDKSELRTNRNLIHTGINLDRTQFSLDYLSLDENFDNTLNSSNTREYIVATTGITLTDEWSVTGMGNRDIEQSSWRSARGSLIYTGKCVSYSLSLGREFTRDRDIEPNTSISFQISLRNLTK